MKEKNLGNEREPVNAGSYLVVNIFIDSVQTLLADIYFYSKSYFPGIIY